MLRVERRMRDAGDRPRARLLPEIVRHGANGFLVTTLEEARRPSTPRSGSTGRPCAPPPSSASPQTEWSTGTSPLPPHRGNTSETTRQTVLDPQADRKRPPDRRLEKRSAQPIERRGEIER